MGGEFHRLVMAALAAGLLVIPGCGAGDGSSQGSAQSHPATPANQPHIIAASLQGTDALRVTYSESVKPVSGVDPAKFRLTVAYYTRPGSASGKYDYSYYSKGYKGYYGAVDHTIYSEVGHFAAMTNDEAAPEQTVLQLGTTFSAATACQEIKAFNAANSNAQAGLYLHYSQAGSPTIEGEDGLPISSLAAYWSSDPTVEQVKGDFAGKPIPVALSCP